MTNRSDDTLMTDYAAGDENALRILVERWERPVFAFLVRMLGSREEAEDLSQDTFTSLVRSAGSYRPDGRFKSWLFRIAGNKARSRLRRRKILRWLPLSNEDETVPSADPDPLDDVLGDETRLRVREAVSRLPDRQRQALVLKQYQDMSYREIAEAMDASVQSVQMLLHRAMNALRKDLGKGRNDP